MEMWWYGRTASEAQLLLWFAGGSLVVALCQLFSGFHQGDRQKLVLDVPITFGVAVLVAALTLLVVGQVQIGRTPLSAAARIVAIETIPCAIGAALALTQFRPHRQFRDVDHRVRRLPQDEQKILATLVGAAFFAFNVAPTEEPWKMTMEAETPHFPILVIVSLVVSYLIVFLADFADRTQGKHRGVLGNALTETLVGYLLSLAVAYVFLVAFGHVGDATPLYYRVAATVMLGYVTTIGGCAGRVLVSE